MRFPYPAPRCSGQDTETFYGFRRFHNCGLRKGHKGPHRCRKHTCRREWARA